MCEVARTGGARLPNHHGSAVYVTSEVISLGASRRKPKLAELFPRRRFGAGADSPPRTPPVAMPKKLIGRDATATLGVSLNTDATSLNNTVKLLSILRPGSEIGRAHV